MEPGVYLLPERNLIVCGGPEIIAGKSQL